MIPILLIEDANTVSQFGWNVVTEFTGGDWILIGILIFLLVAITLLFGKVRSGAAMAIGLSFTYLITLFAPEFSFIFWIAVIASLFLLVMNFRRQNEQ